MFFMKVREEIKKRSAFLLQRYLKGYLAYNRYYARLKQTMTKKNLDYIITRYADSKAFMLECLQVKLAYLVRKMIKRKKIEKELAKKRKIAERKRKEREKELAKLKKIHEKRKVKKKEVKGILKEIVEICYAKEDKRREDTFKKELKK